MTLSKQQSDHIQQVIKSVAFAFSKWRPPQKINRACWQHINSFVDNPFDITKFILYRWWDYELYRIKIAGRLK